MDVALEVGTEDTVELREGLWLSDDVRLDETTLEVPETCEDVVAFEVGTEDIVDACEDDLVELVALEVGIEDIVELRVDISELRLRTVELSCSLVLEERVISLRVDVR